MYVISAKPYRNPVATLTPAARKQTAAFVAKFHSSVKAKPQKNMKSFNIILVLLVLGATAAWSGCAAQKHHLALDPVGPASAAPPMAETNGMLLVFSAYDPNPHFNSLLYRTFYTDYKVFSENGKLLQTVHNDNGTALEGPKTVSLPPGKYRVLAQSNGYGQVTVPVIIRPSLLTTVHLEGGHARQADEATPQGRTVRFPDGQIVGWRAQSREPDAASSQAH